MFLIYGISDQPPRIVSAHHKQVIIMLLLPMLTVVPLNHLGITTLPSPTVSISINGDTLSAFGAASYQWFYNNNSISGANASVYIATQSGNYSVLITDLNGCKATSASVNMVTGLNDLPKEKEIAVYPNPNTTGCWQLTVGSEWMGNDIEVSDAEGRVVFKSKVMSRKSEIRITKIIPSGVYWLRIKSGQTDFNTKLIKL